MVMSPMLRGASTATQGSTQGAIELHAILQVSCGEQRNEKAKAVYSS